MKYLKPLIPLFCILLFGFFNQCNAAGIERYAFLKTPQGAKAMALGGTFVAVADDPSAVSYNPAGIAQTKSKEIFTSYTSWLQGTSITNISSVINLRQHIVSFSYINLDYGTIPETTSASPAGTGNSINPWDRLLTLSYALNVNQMLAGGVNLNFISQNLGQSSSSSQSVDFGMLFKSKKMEGLSIGAACKNLTNRYKLPRSFTGGVAYKKSIEESSGKSSSATVGMDIKTSQGDKPITSIGIEYLYSNLIAIRGGFNSRAEPGASGNLSYGLGLLLPKFNIDFAFVPYEDLGNTYRIALNYKL